jgi:hypothetical protein
VIVNAGLCRFGCWMFDAPLYRSENGDQHALHAVPDWEGRLSRCRSLRASKTCIAWTEAGNVPEGGEGQPLQTNVRIAPPCLTSALLVMTRSLGRKRHGKAAAHTDVVVLRPAHRNGTLLFEVLNCGRKLTPNTDTASGSRAEQAGDASNGFLLSQGYKLVWAAWQSDTGPASA